jgi:hypothetical protein
MAIFTLCLISGRLLLVSASKIMSGGNPPDFTNSGIIALTLSISFTISLLVIILTS